jgi:hypothetical protein
LGKDSSVGFLTKICECKCVIFSREAISMSSTEASNATAIVNARDLKLALAGKRVDKDAPPDKNSEKKVALDPKELFVDEPQLGFTVVACKAADLKDIDPKPLIKLAVDADMPLERELFLIHYVKNRNADGKEEPKLEETPLTLMNHEHEIDDCSAGGGQTLITMAKGTIDSLISLGAPLFEDIPTSKSGQLRLIGFAQTVDDEDCLAVPATTVAAVAEAKTFLAFIHDAERNEKRLASLFRLFAAVLDWLEMIFTEMGPDVANCF